MLKAMKITIVRRGNKILQTIAVQGDAGIKQETSDITDTTPAERRAVILAAGGLTEEDVCRRAEKKRLAKNA